MDSFYEIWETIKEMLRSRVTEVAYNVWLSPLKFVSFQADTITLSISDFKRKIIADKFSHLIEEACSETFGFPVRVQYTAPDNPDAIQTEPGAGLTDPDDEEILYTFDNFIIGPSNRFAHAAALNVANNPGKAYNPLFIYGHSGLGKTHLLSAIMHEIKKNRPNEIILYTSGEQFTNELIYHLKEHNTTVFHEKYRGCDVLLVDDIQFISNKETTQEEFFHTFETLKNAGKQIVLSSDRPPREMLTLEERLRTRFEGGLIADIQAPSLETRMAIVKKKAEELNVDLSDEVVTFIAENIKKNIRQLEGVVKKLAMKHLLSGDPINMEMVLRTVPEYLHATEPVTETVNRIIADVAAHYGVKPDDILGKDRKKNIQTARNVSMYLVRNMTSASLPQIGVYFNRDHSTVHSNIGKVEGELASDAVFEATVGEIMKEIKSGN